jgi:hypothetical protein
VHIILATARPKALQTFAEALSSSREAQIKQVDTGAELHEVSEGLGVLDRLPKDPGVSEATTLLCKLKFVLGMNG